VANFFGPPCRLAA